MIGRTTQGIHSIPSSPKSRPGDRAMRRRDDARTRALAARIRPVLNVIAVVATCAAAAWAGTLV